MRSKRRRLWRRTISILACIVVFCTTYALILPAVTASKETYCGFDEEHQHTQDCYRIDLHSEQNGGDSDGSAQTADSVEKSNESDSSSEADAASDSSALTMSEVQTQKESEPAYSSTPLCGEEEHVHSKICLSNKEDVESEEEWTKNFPDWTGSETDSERVLGIARSQVGYQENKSNFELDSEGKEVFYTRYGDLFANPYFKNWELLFAYFVVHYSETGVLLNEEYFQGKNLNLSDEEARNNLISYKEKMLPRTVDELIKSLQEYGNWKDDSDYRVGDLLFFKSDGESHLGFVNSVKDQNQVDVIAGNQGGFVKTVSLDPQTIGILGYQRIQKQEPKSDDKQSVQNEESKVENDKLDQDKTETSNSSEPEESKVEAEKENGSEQEQESLEVDDELSSAFLVQATISKSSSKQKKSKARTAAIATYSSEEDESGVPATHAAEGTDIEPYLTDVHVSYINGAQASDGYNPGETVNVSLKFNIPKGTTLLYNSLVYEAPEGLKVANAMAGEITDESDNSHIGYYTIDTSGKLIMTFTDEFLAKVKDGDITGRASFYSEIAYMSDSEEKVIDLGGSGNTIIINPVKPDTGSKSDTSTSKSYGGIVTENGKNYYKYEVKVSSKNGSGGPVEFSDIVKSSGIIGSKTEYSHVTLTKGSTTTGYTPQKFTDSDGNVGFKVDNLPELQPGEEYTITYWVKVSEKTGTDGAISLNNAASSKGEGQASIDYKTNQVKRSVVTKEGSYSESTDSIDWTITIDRLEDLVNFNIEDKLLENNVSSKPNSGSIKVIDTSNWQEIAAFDNFPIQFSEEFVKAHGTGPFQIKYSTTVHHSEMKPGETKTYLNTADLRNSKTGSDYKSEKAVEIKTRDYEVKKRAVSHDHWSDHVDQEWESTIVLPDEFINSKNPDFNKITLTDTLFQPVCDQTQISYPGQHFMTKDQLVAMEVKCGSEKLDLGTDYDIYVYSSIPLDQVGYADKIDSFTIKFKNKRRINSTEIKVAYQTTTLLENLPKGGFLENEKFTYKIENAASIANSWVKTEADYNLPRKLVKMTSSKSPAISDGGAAMADNFQQNGVEVNYDDDYVYFSIGFHHELGDTDEVVITDILPPGLICDHDDQDNTLKLYEFQNKWWSPVVKDDKGNLRLIKCSHADGNQEVRFTIYNKFSDGYVLKDDTEYVFFYRAKIDKTHPYWLENLATHNYLSNSARINNLEVKSNFDVIRKMDPLNKTGEQRFVTVNGTSSPTNEIQYRVIINPSGDNLIPELETITLTDEFCQAKDTVGHLITDSVKVYEYDQSKENTDDPYYSLCGDPLDACLYSFNYDPATNTLTMTLPDSKGIILLYSYNIEVNPKDSNLYNPYRFSNSAKLTGVYGANSNSTVSYKRTMSEASAQSKSFRIRKVDSNDYSIGLSGAEFIVEKCKLDSQPDWRDSKVWEKVSFDKAITNEKGEFSVSGFTESGYIYRIKEVKAPDNYDLKDEYYYFACLPDNIQKSAMLEWIKSSYQDEYIDGNHDHNNNRRKLVDEKDLERIVFTYTNAYLVIPNTPSELNVSKKWIDHNGNEIDSNQGELKFQLFKTTSKSLNSHTVTFRFANTNDLSANPSTFDYKTMKTIQVVDGSKLDFIYDHAWDSNHQVYYAVNKDFDNYERMDYVIDKNIHQYLETVIDAVYEDLVIDIWSNEWFIDVSKYKPIYTLPYSIPDSTASVPIDETEEGSKGIFYLTAEGGWQKTFSNLPKTDENGDPINYSIKELSVLDGYTVEYSIKNNLGISSGEITATNRKGPPVLPESGGHRNRFTNTGLILLMVSMIFIGLRTISRKKSS